MKHLRLLFLLLIFSGKANGQSPDSLMRQIEEWPGGTYEKIGKARNYLRDAFAEGDIGLTNAWLGFLQTKLDDPDWAPTASDERWLLYFWTENFGALFTEVADYQRLYSEKYQNQNDPPDDDLFRIVDQASFDRQHELYSSIQRGFLSGEEKAFSILLLDYLLRKDATDEGRAEKNQKAANFIKKYPDSRFNAYVRAHIYNEYQPGKDAFAGDVVFNFGRQNGLLGLNTGFHYGLGINLTYWRRKVHYGLRFNIAALEVERAFQVGEHLIVPDSTMLFTDLGLELAFDLVNTSHFHVAPSAGLSWAFLRAPTSPEFPEDFLHTLKYHSLCWTGALNIDWKFSKTKSASMAKQGSIWWPGVRFRVGYKRLDFGRSTPELAGNQVFASVGLSIFSRPGVKKI